MGQAASAQVGDNISCFRTFITCNIYALYYMVVIFASADGKPDSFGYNSSVLVNAAPLRRLIFRDDIVCYGIEFSKSFVSVPCLVSHFPQNFVFYFLYFVVKQSQYFFPLHLIVKPPFLGEQIT